MRRMTSRVAAKVIQMVTPFIGIVADLLRQGPANPPDVAPHGVKLGFQAMRVVPLNTELTEDCF
jgi:hypothetical protein